MTPPPLFSGHANQGKFAKQIISAFMPNCEKRSGGVDCANKRTPRTPLSGQVTFLKPLTICILLTMTSQIALHAKSPVKAAPSAAKLAMEDKPATKLSAQLIIEKLKEWDTKLLSLKTYFLQEINFKEAGLKKTIKGSMQYVKPNYLRIRHLSPEKQTIVTDKKILWIYKPSDSQVIKTPWDNWFKQNNQLSGILNFGNYAKLANTNNIKVLKTEENNILVDFISKKNPSLYSLTLKLSTTDFFPLGAVLTLEETEISTYLIDTEKNVYISTDIFKFTPPKDAEVIEFGDFK